MPKIPKGRFTKRPLARVAPVGWVGPRGQAGVVAALALLAALAPVAGCERSCLDGAKDCRVVSPCRGLTFSCPGGDALEVRTLGPSEAPSHAPDALAAASDVLIGNGQVVAVIAAVGNQNYLDPHGGSILDLYARGRDNDGINQILQAVGILPDDSVYYDSLTLIDERPKRVAVQVGGTLLHKPEMKVHTLYEIRPCEPGLRVRTEIVNDSPDPQLWALADGWYWSLREPLPFTPAAGRGFEHPSFDLLTINDAFERFPYLAASTHAPPEASYASFGCNVDLLEGFQSETVSTSGLPRTIVPPRDDQVYERFIAVSPRGDENGAAEIALRARQQPHGGILGAVTGRVSDGGGQAMASVSILISEGRLATPIAQRTPWAQAMPGADGSFRALVPGGRDYVLEVHRFGRKVAEKEVGGVRGGDGGDVDAGTIVVPGGADVSIRVSGRKGGGGGDEPIPAEIFFAPVDAATEQALAGDFHGQYPRCAPWLGPPHGPSPACNRVLVPPGQTVRLQAPAGRYHVYAFHGPFFTLARQTVDLAPGGPIDLSFTLEPLPLLPSEALSADLHVHGAASFDSSIPDVDRVLSFAAAGVDVIVATDHEVVHDYRDTIASLGLAGTVYAVSGVETTGHIPFLRVPGDPFPRVIGHYNFWPLAFRPGTPRDGAPFDEFVEPGELFDRVEPLFTGVALIQLNHPMSPADFGRDLGFPRAIHLNLLRDLPAADDGTNAGMYVRVPAGGHANDDHQAQEVMNGSANEDLLAHRAFWFYTLNQGRLKTGTANSDSHGLTDNSIGSPRNVLLERPIANGRLDVDAFNTAIRAGHLIGTNGPMITATLQASDGGWRQPGVEPFRPADSAMLRIEVSAAPWVPVDEVRIVVNGKVVKTIDGAALTRPQDPFGTRGLLRYMDALPLAPLLPPAGDAWIVVEAGTWLPVAADLGGGDESAALPHGAPDGIPDTTDNNGDGRIDFADIADGNTVGPLRNPPVPEDESDPRYHFARVVNGGYPIAFTNPFVLDRNGDGRFTAPGVTGGW